MAYEGGFAYIRDLAGNVIRVATLVEAEAEGGGGSGLTLLDSGDLLFEDIVWAAEPEVPGFGLIASGTIIVAAWAVMDWDFSGSTWVNTGVLSDCSFQILLAKPDKTGGIDLVTYDLVANQPAGDGWLIEFGPLVSTFNAGHVLINLRRSAVANYDAKLFMQKLNDGAEVTTGRFRVFALVSA